MWKLCIFVIQEDFHSFQLIMGDFLKAFGFNLKKKKHIKFREMYEIFIWVDRTIFMIQCLKMISWKCWPPQMVHSLGPISVIFPTYQPISHE